MTGLDLVKAAFYDVNILGAGEELSPEDFDYGLAKLNRIWDQWNAKRAATYAETFPTFTLTPALSPQTIGPTGALVVAQRPVSIEAMNLVVSGVKTPIDKRDADWFHALAAPAITSAIPTDFYYEPNWPLGKIYLYPVPTAASTVELMIRQVLTAFDKNTTFTLPPGYQEALTLTLAEGLAPAYPGAVVTSKLERDAADARAVIFGNNTQAPRLVTRDAGMPGGGGGAYDYRTGRVR